MADVIALGELLIDFVPTEAGLGVGGTLLWERAPGGAPANVAVGLARLGISTAFLGMVGDDPFGHYLAAILRENQVDVRGLRFNPSARTALAFVALQADGERDFMFYRHPSADMLYTPTDVEEDVFDTASIFHCGSISVISEPSRAATYHALDLARKYGLIVSIDPNLRLPLWPSAKTARTEIRELLPYADVIKVSDEEATFLTGETDLGRAMAALWHDNLKLLLLTQGNAGCTYRTAHGSGTVASIAVQAVDTTGAGDSFVAATLASLAHTPALWDDYAALEQTLRRANIAGALTTTQRGGIPALPTWAQIEAALGDG